MCALRRQCLGSGLITVVPCKSNSLQLPPVIRIAQVFTILMSACRYVDLPNPDNAKKIEPQLLLVWEQDSLDGGNMSDKEQRAQFQGELQAYFDVYKVGGCSQRMVAMLTTQLSQIH